MLQHRRHVAAAFAKLRKELQAGLMCEEMHKLVSRGYPSILCHITLSLPQAIDSIVSVDTPRDDGFQD